MKAFLMLGQSNMAGRGDFGEVPEIVNPHCFMLRNGRWQPMSEPINPDRRIFGSLHSGVGLAASFADEYANHFHEDIGLIPCADGGTSLKQWLPGEILYENAICQTKLALKSSDLAGILWHQGESDCKQEEDADQYHDRFLRMINSLKKDLALPPVPVIIGELGEFMEQYNNGALKENYRKINQTLNALAHEIDRGGFVSAKGLTCKSDGLHFNSKSYRTFGKRYFDTFLHL